ncbi:class II aldolase [Chlorella virus XW01]|nr:class II aldolase [Chlorella virus XW01]
MFYKGIILDLDNTIYNYDYYHNKAINSVFSFINQKTNIEISVLKDYYNTISTSLKYELKNTASSHNKLIYFKKLIEHISLNNNSLNNNNIISLNDIYWNTFFDNIKCFDYFEEFIKWNKNIGIKIAILTDYQTEYQLIKLEKLNINQYIDIIITSEEIGIEKPSNYGFLSILNKMKLNNNEVIMIGDNYEKDILGAENLNIKSYNINIINNNNFYKNLLFDFTNIYNELINLKKISQYCGERFDLVQAGGGNTSVKINDLLIIKSSGINLSTVNEKSGYTIIDNKKLLLDINKNHKDFYTKEISHYNYFGNSRGSIETFMHSFLKKYTVHLHPIQINQILISKNAKSLLQNILEDINDVLIIDYYTPGIKLANIIKEKYNNQNIIYLINHGIIFTTNNYNEIYDLIENTIIKFEKYNNNNNNNNYNYNKYKYTNFISKIINNFYNINNITYLSQNSTLKNYLSNISNFNYQISFPDCLIYCGYKVCFNINNLNKNDKPIIIIYNNEIYINSTTLNKCKDIEEVLIANLLILDNKYEKNYLSNDELYYLSNWDAELFRKNL